ETVGRECRGAGPESLRGAGPGDVARAQGGRGGGRRDRDHGFTRLPGGAVLRLAAGRVSPASAVRRQLPDPPDQPELVRGNAPQGAGARNQGGRRLGGGARGGAP